MGSGAITAPQFFRKKALRAPQLTVGGLWVVGCLWHRTWGSLGPPWEVFGMSVGTVNEFSCLGLATTWLGFEAAGRVKIGFASFHSPSETSFACFKIKEA